MIHGYLRVIGSASARINTAGMYRIPIWIRITRGLSRPQIHQKILPASLQTSGYQDPGHQ